MAFFVGFFGDIGLQMMNSMGYNIGLDEYFKTHGTIESLMIAAGLTQAAYNIYLFLPFEKNLLVLGIYSAIIDLAFRYGNIMPTLRGYYERFDIPTTILWAFLPLWWSEMLTWYLVL